MSDELTDPTGERHDLALGDGHWLDWLTTDAGERYGALIWNTCPAKNGVMGDGAMCAGHVRWDTATAPPGAHVWTLNGAADEHLTLSPSVLCRNCNDHGFLRDGRWIRA